MNAHLSLPVTVCRLFMAAMAVMAPLFMAAVLLPLLFACSSDDPMAPASTQLAIVKSDLLFEPMGRTGSIEIAATGQVTAELQSSWCSATVDGRVVSVTTTDNTSFEGRTAILTIKADGLQVQVPVQQRGMALGSLDITADHIGNEGGRLAYYIRHDLKVNLTTDDDWIHPRMEGDSLIVECDANDSGHLRRGAFDFECAGYTSQLDITQYDLADILGDYFFSGSGMGYGFHFYLTEQNGQFFTTFQIHGCEEHPIPVQFDVARCELTLHSATTIYTEGNIRYVYYLYDTAGKVLTSTEPAYRARIYYNPFATASGGAHYATLEQASTWTDGVLQGWTLFIVTDLSTMQVPNYLFPNPYILRTGPITQ